MILGLLCKSAALLLLMLAFLDSSAAWKVNRVFIFGIGYTGRFLIDEILQKYPHCHISGTCRSVEKADQLQKLGIEAFPFDMDNDVLLSRLGLQSLKNANAVLSTIPTTNARINAEKDVTKETCVSECSSTHNIKDYEDSVLSLYRSLIEESIARETCTYVAYMSTTGVYGDHQGEWVDETSACRLSPTSKAYPRFRAEQQWLNISGQVKKYVFRLAGIYGPHRSALHTYVQQRIAHDGDDDDVSRRNRGKMAPYGDTNNDKGGKDNDGDQEELNGDDYRRTVNRVHVMDIVTAITSSLFEQNDSATDTATIYNLADNEPAAREKVMQYCKELCEGIELQELCLRLSIQMQGIKKPRKDREGSIRARRRQQEHKKVDNAKAKAQLWRKGEGLIFPSYREGLLALLERGSS